MAENQEYPLTFLRGIPNKSPQFFDSNDQITGGIFRPADEQLPVDDFYELSINWEDDSSILNITLQSRLEDGELHFKGGAARISRQKIDEMQQEPPYKGVVKYRRSPLIDNKYHGDLLLQRDACDEKARKKALRERLRRAIIEVL